MRIVDLHSHWGTRAGYPLRSPEELARQKATWNSEPVYVSEDEMADYFRASDVKTILDLGFTKHLGLSELQSCHDYAFEVQRRHPDVILGHWLQIDPRLGDDGAAELSRRLDEDCFVGLAVSGTSSGVPATNALWEPFYAVCRQRGAPILVLVGYTGAGAGLPGGEGMLLDHCHPRHVDAIAARHPDLTIVASRPAWPWQAEMIAVLLHKPNVWYELHGWRPKYLSPDLLHEIPRRLTDRIMFGADYPLFTYERLVTDWQAHGFDSDVLARVFHANAERFLAQLEQGVAVAHEGR